MNNRRVCDLLDGLGANNAIYGHAKGGKPCGTSVSRLENVREDILEKRKALS